MFWAFQAGSFGRGALAFAIGGLTLICGIALLANPLFASASCWGSNCCSSGLACTSTVRRRAH
jgi:hypothetical protein